MKRKISAAFKKARSEMIARKTKCHECENYATELHHIIAVEDGGTDDIENLMPLCKECHEEYTTEQTEERNKMWVALNMEDNGEVKAQFKDEQDTIPLGKMKIESEGTTPTKSKIHYEYEWIVTVEIPAISEQESKEKLKKFRSELFNRYAMTDDVWLTGIRRWKDNK